MPSIEVPEKVSPETTTYERPTTWAPYVAPVPMTGERPGHRVTVSGLFGVPETSGLTVSA